MQSYAAGVLTFLLEHGCRCCKRLLCLLLLRPESKQSLKLVQSCTPSVLLQLLCADVPVCSVLLLTPGHSAAAGRSGCLATLDPTHLFASCMPGLQPSTPLQAMLLCDGSARRPVPDRDQLDTACHCIYSHTYLLSMVRAPGLLRLMVCCRDL